MQKISILSYLSIAQIQAIGGKALSICAANPQMPAVRAFHAAIRTHEL